MRNAARDTSERDTDRPKGEAEKHDVSRHVRREDVTQPEVADGVDQTGRGGENEEHHRHGIVAN
jgi:hypothetical protein